MDLKSVSVGIACTVRAVETGDGELDAFLFSLGCYSGSRVTVVSRRRGGCVVAIKDARYCFDAQLARSILV